MHSTNSKLNFILHAIVLLFIHNVSQFKKIQNEPPNELCIIIYRVKFRYNINYTNLHLKNFNIEKAKSKLNKSSNYVDICLKIKINIFQDHQN